MSGPANRLLAQPTTDAKGQFSVTVTVPSVPAGTYGLSAEGQTSFAYAATTLVATKG
jgi:hypothetical protein